MSEVEFFGERYPVADKIGLMPLMRFARVAEAGVDSGDMAGLAAMYDLLEQCIADESWPAFQRAATRNRADGDDLMRVVKDAIEAIAARPTGRPSDSSDGPAAIEPRSVTEPVSSEPLRLIRDLEEQGRADKAEFVAMAQRAASAS